MDYIYIIFFERTFSEGEAIGLLLVRTAVPPHLILGEECTKLRAGTFAGQEGWGVHKAQTILDKLVGKGGQGHEENGNARVTQSKAGTTQPTQT